jgi:tetratricopeptide (TPR) repeat protein
MSICTLCKNKLLDSLPEKWTLPAGDVVKVARSKEPSVVVDTSVGEFVICESCYRRGLPSFFAPLDVATIHYQFGLEYRDRAQFSCGVESLTQARRITETADIVANLAYVEGELGHRELAITHYRRALEIDPSHFMSRQNLQRIYDSAA